MTVREVLVTCDRPRVGVVGMRVRVRVRVRSEVVARGRERGRGSRNILRDGEAESSGGEVYKSGEHDGGRLSRMW